MFRRIARSALPVVALVAAGAALTACNPNDDPSPAGAASASASGGSDSSGQGSSQAGAQPGGSGSSDTKNAGGNAAGSGKSSTVECLTDQLKATTKRLDAGAGHVRFQIVFQNTGSQACTLQGYPGVSFVDDSNAQLGKAASRTKSAAGSTVTLIPNAHAYADLQTVNGQGGYTDSECKLTDVPALRVYPPNQTASVNIPWNQKECVGPDVQNLQVGPVHTEK